MKLLRLFPLELGRLLHSRMTWLIVLLTVISPAVGLVLYKPAIASTVRRVKVFCLGSSSGPAL